MLGVNWPSMSFRDHASNIMDNLIASGIYSAAILAALKFWPRIVTKFTALRVGAAVVPALLIGRLRAVLLRRRAKVGQLTGISQGTSQSYGLLTNATPEPLPPGTASAIVMANQPPIQRVPMPMPAYVNNSMMMHWEAARQQEAALAAHLSTMPRFSAATLRGGNSPPGY